MEIGVVTREVRHLFAGHERLGDVAAQLAAHAPDERDQLRALLPPTYLKPLWGIAKSPRAMLRVLDGRNDRFILESADINRVGA